MPIFIRNYNWKQSIDKIHITVPLKDANVSNLHLFASEKYIKLNFPPYIFELVLSGTVQSKKSKCFVKAGEIILELVKEEAGIWAQLSENIERKELVNVKKEIIENVQRAAAVDKETNEKKKSEQTHFLRDYQMTVNKEERQKIQILKDEQKANAMRELVVWKTELKYRPDKIQKTVKSKADPGEYEVNIPVPVPFPRNDGVIKFSFTPRLLPTPKRESKTVEEEEWLRKQAEAMRTSGFVAADLSEEEKDPGWLLDKGMSFIRTSNYLGALNVFEYATKVCPKMAVLYVKLAETLLKLNRLPKAVDKATMALELLTPVVHQNKNLRVEAYRIRAEAYDRIGEQEFSAADYRELENIKMMEM